MSTHSINYRHHGLRVFRLALLGLMVWIIRDHHERVRVAGDAPLQVAEVKMYFPSAATLRLETGGREGWEVLDADGRRLGYAVRTQPHCHDIIGYCGVTDALIAFNLEWRVLGVKVRRSEDTIRHLEDVVSDRHFLKTWNNRTWDEIAELNLRLAGIEGVSGATRTSMAIAESVTQRLAMVSGQKSARVWQIHARDGGLVCVMAMGLLLAFKRVKNYSRIRLGYQALVVLYVGFISGDLLAQSLLAGWARSGIGWRMAPALTLLAAAAFFVPWLTGRPWYCQYLCPYGMLQEWVGKISKWSVGQASPQAESGVHSEASETARGDPPTQAPAWRTARSTIAAARPTGAIVDLWLRRLPAALLLVVLVVTMWDLPLDLAGLEPFDAFKALAGVTLLIALAGLVAARFVPQAYCRYGCPTGALLEFLRPRGPNDRLGARDGWAVSMVLTAWALAHGYEWFTRWLQ